MQSRNREHGARILLDALHQSRHVPAEDQERVFLREIDRRCRHSRWKRRAEGALLLLVPLLTVLFGGLLAYLLLVGLLLLGE